MVDDIHDYFNDEVTPIASETEQNVRKLWVSHVKNELRVAVPALDSESPTPPWNTECKSRSAVKGIQDIRRYCWPPRTQDEQKLRWNPFLVSLECHEIREKIHDDGSVTTYIKKPENVSIDDFFLKDRSIRSSWNSPEADEKIGQAAFPPESMATLIRRRQLQVEHDRGHCFDGAQKDELSTETAFQMADAQDRSPRKKLLHGSISAEHSRSRAPTGVEAGIGSLESFLSIRRGSAFNTAQSTPLTKRTLHETHETEQGRSRQHQAVVKKRDLERLRQTLKHPLDSTQSTQRSFVLSEEFLNNRDLIRPIQASWPFADFIMRDHRWSENLPAQSMARQDYQFRHRSIREADLILSPSTALLWTTLQQIRQRPLPGHGSFSPIQDRVQYVAARYERLFVLVSQDVELDDYVEVDIDEQSLLLGNNDCEVISQFTKFTRSLEDDVQTMFVYGGRAQLASHIAGIMTQYSSTLEDLRLSQEESPQEIFLQMAGMNAFAAQIVLSSLEAMNEYERNCGPSIAMLVLMTASERISQFEHIMGGRKVLEKVSSVLDQDR